MFTVIVKATSYEITPGEEAMDKLLPLLDSLTYEDEYQQMTKTLGFIYDEETDSLFLHRGVNIEYLRRLLGDAEFKKEPFHEFKEIKFDYEELYPPRNAEQQDAIDFIAGEGPHKDNINDQQIFLVKTTGFGKTYCSSTAICKLGMKTLIIVHRDSLRTQWMESLHRMIGMKEDVDFHEIKDTKELEDIANGIIPKRYDVYLLMHATFRAGLKRIGSMRKAMNITKNLGIGFKIIDETHLEFRDTILMDCIFNVKRNLYLTATDGRSSRDENSIFKLVFSNTTYYRDRRIEVGDNGIPSKWVEYTTVYVDSKCNPNIYRWKVNGGRGMNPASYGKWVIMHDKKQTHFKACIDLLRMLYERDEKSKILVFVPLIEICTELAHEIVMALNYDDNFPLELKVRTINSTNSKSDNLRNRAADVIVTTIASCGTGTDISGITGIICMSPFVSKLTAKQTFGRIRYFGRTGYYYDIVDTSVEMDKFWWRSRSKTLKPLSTKFNEMYWYDDTNEQEKE